MLNAWLVGIAVAALAAGILYLVYRPKLRRRKAVRILVDRARDEVRRAPDDLDARARLASVLIRPAGRASEALPLLDEILEREPAHWAGDLKPTRMLRAEALVELGRLEDAIAGFEGFVGAVGEYRVGADEERKWQLEMFKVEAEQRIRLLRKGDTHVHQPERWGDAQSL